VQGRGERDYVLDIANFELAGTETVNLCACSTNIPLAVHTTKGDKSVRLRIQDQVEIIIHGQVEITEVGRRTNPGGGGTHKKQRVRGSGNSGEETDDGTSDESAEYTENEIGILAHSERRAQRRREDDAVDSQHPNVAESVEEWTIEDVCTFVQALSLESGDQASGYAAKMKEEEIDGKALLHLSAADLEELGVSPKHRSRLLARIQDLTQ